MPARALAVCGLLVLAVGLVFGQSVRHEFVNLDDGSYVYENRQVSAGLTAQGISWAFADRHCANWHPLTWLSLMADCQLYGLHAGGHHLTNDLLHAASAVLLFLVLRQMSGCFWPSAVVAALFAVHPLRVESVAWVTERKDVLSGLFFLLTLAAYVGYARRPFSLGRYLLLGLVFALGLLAKQSLVTLPLLLLLLDYWPLRRMGSAAQGFSFPWPLIAEKVPLFVLSGVSSLVAVWAASETQPGELLPLWWRIGNAPISYVAYLGQFFYPRGLAAFYPRPGLDFPMWKIGGACLILLAITVAVCVGRRRCPYLLVGWLWYLAVLLPVIGLVQVGMGTMADRFTYLPQIGLCIAFVWGATDLIHRWHLRHWACGVASALVLVALMGAAWRQTSFWRDSETLWTQTLACTSQNFVAHNDLGLALANQGRLDEAIAEYHESLAIKPDHAEALNNLGLALFRQRRLDEAIAQYEKALKMRPGYPQALNNRGAALARLGRFEEAMADYQQAVELKPDYFEAHNNLAIALANQGRFQEAMARYRTALELRPDSAEALNNLGRLFARLGQFDEAIAQYQKAVELKPDLAEPHNNLGTALADRGRTAEAMAEYHRALQIKPDYAEARGNLGNALAAQGRIAEAMVQYRQALELATRHNQRALADALRAKMALYGTGNPGPQPPTTSGPPKP